MPMKTPFGMRLALIGSALLLVLGFAAFWYASNRGGQSSGQADAHAVTVTIKSKVCDPSDITVPAGTTTFTIVNETDRALEWEILDGVMVVDERENITPGMRQSMTVKLLPGDYEITCGLLNNPRGKLRVTPSAESKAEAARPSLVAYVGPLAEYQVYLLTEAEALDTASHELVNALRAGQADKARKLYATAHQSYVRIEPAAQLFGDLEANLNARPEYFEKREADPNFIGFRKIASGLASGSDPKSLAPIGDKLLADLATLKERLAAIELRPEQLGDLPAKQLRGMASGLANGESSTDLRGAYEGSAKIAELLSPLLAKADPGLEAKLKADLARLDLAIDVIKDDRLDGSERSAMGRTLADLADDFVKANGALGLK